MGDLEQLWYTWSEDGLEGRGRFQIRAASPGLQDVSSARVQRLVRECSFPLPNHLVYEREREWRISSTGFLDDGSDRIVFHKSASSSDQGSRPGQYFVHVLTGPRASLRADELVRRVDSPSWRRSDAGFGPSTTLPTTSLAEIEVPESPSGEAPEEWAVHAAVEWMTSNPQAEQQILVEPAEATGPLLASVSRALPPALFDQFSFSTYEPEPDRSTATILGVEAPLGREDPGSHVRLYTTRRGSRSRVPIDPPTQPSWIADLGGSYRDVIELAGHSALYVDDAGASKQALQHNLATIERLVAGEVRLPADDLRAVLQPTDALIDLLHRPTIWTAILEHAGTRESGPWASLAGAVLTVAEWGPRDGRFAACLQVGTEALVSWCDERASTQPGAVTTALERLEPSQLFAGRVPATVGTPLLERLGRADPAGELWGRLARIQGVWFDGSPEAESRLVSAWLDWGRASFRPLFTNPTGDQVPPYDLREATHESLSELVDLTLAGGSAAWAEGRFLLDSVARSSSDSSIRARAAGWSGVLVALAQLQRSSLEERGVVGALRQLPQDDVWRAGRLLAERAGACALGTREMETAVRGVATGSSASQLQVLDWAGDQWSKANPAPGDHYCVEMLDYLYRLASFPDPDDLPTGDGLSSILRRCTEDRKGAGRTRFDELVKGSDKPLRKWLKKVHR